MRRFASALMIIGVAPLCYAQPYPFNDVSSGTNNSNQTLTVGSTSVLTTSGTGQINGTYTSSATGGQLSALGTRLGMSGYLYAWQYFTTVS